MKRGIIGILLISILLLSPLVQAQDQAQTYSGFSRFIDNIKLFFSGGDNKVELALEIREKEVNSAIINIKEGNNKEAEKNLERARKKLQLVQRKVSKNIAEDVKANINETINKINEEENLPDSFGNYILEEEKTELTAELVIEVEGKEGQTLTREIVKDSESGEKKVEMVVEGELEGQIQEQTKTREIETRINEIDEEIADIIVQNNVVKTGMDTDDLDKRDPDATPKTPAGDVDNTVDPGPQGIVGSDHE